MRELFIAVDADERETIACLRLDLDSYAATRLFIGQCLATWPLDWIDPTDTDELIQAPMLGILGATSVKAELPSPRYGQVLVGRWNGQEHFQPIVQRWIWRSGKPLLRQLFEKGCARLVSGNDLTD